MPPSLTKQERYTIVLLFCINILNYIDRFSVAAILGDLKNEFEIGDDYCGLLQTAFILAYTFFAPVFGYLGDRYPRRVIMISSVLLWTTATVFGSFMTTYRSFFISRTFVGIGEASFSTIAPTVIYDISGRKNRRHSLALFYTAIPIGAGLAFVVSSTAADIGGHWCWGLRVTPVMCVISCVLMWFAKDPIRGERECLESGGTLIRKTLKYKDNLRHLYKNRSYILSTLGFTSVTFVTGALSWWGAQFLHSGYRLIPGQEHKTLPEVARAFGIIAITTGLIGTPLGAFISKRLHKRYPSIDPVICAFGLISSAPLIILALVYSNKSTKVTYGTVFIGELFLNIIWTVVADILLSVVVPDARSSAEAFQIAISHTLGDAGSPYLVGLISEQLRVKWVRKKLSDREHTELTNQFEALRYALSSIVVIQFLGGMLFIINAIYIVEDRKNVLRLVSASCQHSQGLESTEAKL